MTYNELYKLLENHGQTHLLKYWDELSEESKANLAKQIENIDWKLLDILKNRSEIENRGVLAPLGALEIDEIEARKEEFEKVGIEAIKAGKVCAVLLAGGQGTRLGSDKPKGMYNIGITHPLYIFECLINNMMDVVKQAGAWMPLCIMTSEKNNDDTVAFFEEMNYFGYNKDYVNFFVQEMAPSVDYNGKIYMEGKDRISLSPNGNGGWFTSIFF